VIIAETILELFATQETGVNIHKASNEPLMTHICLEVSYHKIVHCFLSESFVVNKLQA
jgi:hypothetical protein